MNVHWEVKTNARRYKCATMKYMTVCHVKIHFDFFFLLYCIVVLRASKCTRRRMKAGKSTNEICKRG